MKNKIFQSRDLCLRTLDTNSTCAKCVRRNEEKMEVLLAKSAGFCFGVKRAVDRVYELAQTSAKIYTYGPIIHNEEVVGDLEKKGVSVIETKEELSQIKEGVIVIRSHGVAKEIYDQIEQQGLECVDATCPFVKRIHNIVEKESANGKQILIIGNAGHPEVEGIMGWSSTPAMVAECTEEIEQIHCNPDQPVCIVSQTTFNYNKFQELVEIIQKKGYYSVSTVDKDSEIIVHNTICSATKERQEAAKELSAKVDAMLVIGGLSSSNTRKLYEICSENCRNTYFIQTKEDLENSDFSRFDYVGITAGASTPNNIIEEVQKYVRNEF